MPRTSSGVGRHRPPAARPSGRGRPGRAGRLGPTGGLLLAAWLAAGGCVGKGTAVCPEDTERPAPARVAPAGRGDPDRGAVLFAEHCSGCHAPLPAARESWVFRGYPRLDCPAWLAGVSDDYLYALIAEGGEVLGRDPLMRGFADRLSPGQILDLIAHLRDATP